MLLSDREWGWGWRGGRRFRLGGFFWTLGLVLCFWGRSKQVLLVTFEDIQVLSSRLWFFLGDLFGSGTGDLYFSFNFISVFFEKSIIFRLFACRQFPLRRVDTSIYFLFLFFDQISLRLLHLHPLTNLDLILISR